MISLSLHKGKDSENFITMHSLVLVDTTQLRGTS